MFHPTNDMLTLHPKYYYQERLAELELTAATGTSSVIRQHLLNHSELFKTCSRRIKSQLASAGYDADECLEMEEKLCRLAEQYVG